MERSRILDEFAAVTGYIANMRSGCCPVGATGRRVSRMQMIQVGLDPDVVDMVPRCAMR